MFEQLVILLWNHFCNQCRNFTHNKSKCFSVHRNNMNAKKKKIQSVLCPGLATSGGQMSFEQCAKQMKIAYEVCVLGEGKAILNPDSLLEVHKHQLNMEGLEWFLWYQKSFCYKRATNLGKVRIMGKITTHAEEEKILIPRKCLRSNIWGP